MTKQERDQVMRVYSGEFLDEIREDMRKRTARRLLRFRIKWAIRDFCYYAGTVIAATIVAVAYLATIAIICGY